MTRSLIVVGSLLLVLGGVATLQGSEGLLRMVPATFLASNRTLVAGPDIPGRLTTVGILVVYILPGIALVALGVVLLYRLNSRSAPDEP